MHKSLLFFGLCCVSSSLLAQSVPRFQMPLYFEDAVGNRDTIVVGYDAMGSYDTLNPQFGEVGISTPFDSVFEVRAAHAIDEPHALSKKIIAHYEGGGNDTCLASAGIEIFIQAKYLPITLHYDSALVNSSYCHRNMILSPDWFIFLVQYWWDAREYHCMTHTNMVVDTFTHPGTPHIGGDDWLSRPYEVEGQGVKEIPGYFWIVKYIGICQYQVSTQASAAPVPQIKLSPNPASDQLQIAWPTAFSGHLQVFGIAGNQTQVYQTLQAATTTKLNIEQLPAGLYFLSVRPTNGHSSMHSFVVMH